ncbi:14102_t:CDS:2 [Cetraspora pellucida]|uniref:14102_t:CDS:1 n=1 Tax=Cetraspora pellucida TaxID=1433469 RepID=A0A9N9HGZ5_9GLOM|nr:14102_t:CDS:2 [Cetraspora pellucida]
MIEKRTVLLLGRTGNGKSTVANVISDSDKFAESEYGVSETRGIQEEVFRVENENIDFHIIDTIGIGDTRFGEKEVLNKLADATNAIKNGLNQILFVTSGRFTEEEVKAYTLLRTVFFADNIGEYTTVVRTKFPSFRKAEKCKNDREKMTAENEYVADILTTCKKLIHVNNMTEEEDPELRSRRECRDILRAHLKFNCGVVYRPKNLDEINDRIRNHMTDKERIQNEMDGIKELLRQSQERAENVEEEARKREEKLQQEFKETLDNLSSQYSAREDNIAATMAEQMNAKLSAVEASYGTTINELKTMMENLTSQLNSERTQHQTDMKDMRDFYDRQHTKTTQAFENAIRSTSPERTFKIGVARVIHELEYCDSSAVPYRRSEYGISRTRGVQEVTFWAEENIEFHIIDTIGIGDTKFNENEVLYKLVDATNAIKNGLNQIFFVTSGRFTEEEVKAYNLIQTVFFADDISKYTTIIRTNFPSFRRSEKCKADREKMIAENKDVADIILSCNKLIHVNNMNEEEDPELRSRKECRDILRAHLKFNCGVVYRPRNLDEINERIRNYMTDKERIQKEMVGIKEQLRQSQERAQNSEAAAYEKEEKLQQEFEETLINLACQHSAREASITTTMTEQMNVKLSEVETTYGIVVSELISMTDKLNIQINSERAQHQNDMREMRKWRDFYDQLM